MLRFCERRRPLIQLEVTVHNNIRKCLQSVPTTLLLFIFATDVNLLLSVLETMQVSGGMRI